MTSLADATRTGYQAGKYDGFEEGYEAGFEAGADVGAHRILLALQAGWPDLKPARRPISHNYLDLLDGPGVASPCTCSCCRRWREGRGG